MLTKRLSYPALLLCAALSVRTQAAWTDKTSGLPWLQFESARAMGSGSSLEWFVTEDALGRLLVGGDSLSVFDGQSWANYPAGKSVALRALAFGPDGRLWAGALNELGYYTEETLGNFRYHSLLDRLPAEERLVSNIWGCSVVGGQVFFMGREKLYRWDGTAFRIWNFPGESRLFPFKAGTECWFQHRESGLYRLTEEGPRLEIARDHLPDAAVLGQTRDRDGVILLTSDGFVRPGNPPQSVFGDELNRFIGNARPTCYVRLADGTQVVGTVNGGLVFFDDAGRILRHVDTEDHPGVATIMSLHLDAHGVLWGATSSGIFHLETAGAVTLHGARNGLEGGAQDIAADADGLFACSRVGVFRLDPRNGRPARVVRLPGLHETYTNLQPYRHGLLLGRHGGIDFFDGRSVSPVYNVLAKGVYRIRPSTHQPESFLLSEGNALVRLQPEPGGGFTLRRFGQIPDFGGGLEEDDRGQAWVATPTQGAFVVDPDTGDTKPVNDPVTHQPMAGFSCLARTPQDLIVFTPERILRAEPDGTGLRPFLPLPGITPRISAAVPGSRDVVVAFSRFQAQGGPAAGQGLGWLRLGDQGDPLWQEIDAPALATVGLPQTLKVTGENGRKVLWVGGTEGLLRLDYEQLRPMTAPTAPFIRLNTTRSTAPTRTDSFTFPFHGHLVEFQVFTGRPLRTSDWLVQTRLAQNGAAWSPPSARRSYDFNNLSEGEYRFEARTLNAAGMASEPAVFTFRILPPWYRSKEAYLAYALLLALGLWATMRFRERRIRAQKEALEKLVQVRTAELIKANAAKDEFLAGVSHEIRNPMNGVIGIAESLRSAGLDEESRRKFGLLRQCAGHLSSLLEDLLDFSKMQAGVVEIEDRAFDLPELVEAVASMAAADSEKYGIPFETAISPAVPRSLRGDPRRVRQILLNFVSNALKFSGRGKVELTVWCQPGRAAGRVEVIFAVTDEGPGISAEEQKRLFGRFERGAAARQGRVPGTGLGLALCKGYAERMGGRIWLESEPDRGSCFYFSAPFAEAEEETASSPAAAAPAVPGQAALVVDDQEYNRIVLVDLLAKLGCPAAAAASGAEALALARSGDFRLVFLDYDIPDMNGPEIARQIRRLASASARARIFATTAFSTPEKQQRCLDAGMDATLGKPVTLERLRRALAQNGSPDDAADPAPAPLPPADPLANLRLLASKKGVPLAEELALYLSELDVELAQLEAAIRAENAAEAAHYAHRLCGRCSFIQERETEGLLRQIEEAAARGHWPEARRLAAPLAASAAAFRLRVSSSAPVVPPA